MLSTDPLMVISLYSYKNETDVLYLGDFKCRIDYNRNKNFSNFLRTLNNFSLVNPVNKPTYNLGHT